MDTELKGYISDLQTTAADLQSQIDDPNTEIENVKKEIGDEIDALEQSLLNKLDNLKATLEGELATIKANIETLKAKDTELEDSIAALETYVDTQLQGTKDWANATFATLAQYEEIQGTIAGIKGDIAAINTAIANLETRINEKIATDIKAAIDALRTELGTDYAAKIEAATDDAAHKQWGYAWRVPTFDEFQELIDNCSWVWTTLNDINGYQVTGSNGKSIFLPASGDRAGTEIRGRGSDCDYWSSSLSSSYCYGAFLLSASRFVNGAGSRATGSRSQGRNVRPVYD